MLEHGDITIATHGRGYRSILHKTYFVLEHAVRHYRAAFVLKTDDDAFINVPALQITLKNMCALSSAHALTAQLHVRRLTLELDSQHKVTVAADQNHFAVTSVL